MGRSLGIQICEGVETPLQLAQLRNDGCRQAQGFLFARPVPADDLASLLAVGLNAMAGPGSLQLAARLHPYAQDGAA